MARGMPKLTPMRGVEIAEIFADTWTVHAIGEPGLKPSTT